MWLDPAATPQSVTVFEELPAAGGGKGGAVSRSPLQHLTVEPCAARTLTLALSLILILILSLSLSLTLAL